jgi:uncharacterized protein involved in type VI secretion and phage assembly
MAVTQEGRLIRIDTELDTDKLLLLSVAGQEAISRPFSYRLELLSETIDPLIEPASVIGTYALISIRMTKEKTRYRSGFFRNFQASTVHGDFRGYRAELVPWLSFMQLSTDFRIFQDYTVVELLSEMFGEFKLTRLDMTRLRGTYPKMEYRVQCRETAFDFVARLMEENGIYYYFEHDETGHTLVLGDDLLGFQDAEEFSVSLGDDTKDGKVSNWEHAHDYRTGEMDLRDFSFTTPTVPPEDKEPGHGKLPAGNKHSRYTFPETIRVSEDARRIVVTRMQEEEAAVHTVTGNAACVTFLPGFRFKIAKSEKLPAETGISYVITSNTWTALEHSYRQDFWHMLGGSLTGLWRTDTAKTLGLGALGDATSNTQNLIALKVADILKSVGSGGLTGVLELIFKPIIDWFKQLFAKQAEFTNRFIAIPATILFRPPRTTPKPRIYGPHTAVVIGPTGLEPKEGNDIATDQFGRVRVKFPWDRGVLKDATGETSCWIRVTEAWAGSKSGSQFPPRVGQEVIVQFIDGDPDRPVITGRLYNPVFLQPFDAPGTTVAPLKPGPLQPSDAHLQTSMRQSGIRTASTPRATGAKDRFHMLRFDDNAKSEQLLLRSQGRTDVTSFGSYFETDHGSRHFRIGGKDPDTGKRGGSLYITTGDEYDLHVGGDRYEMVDKGYQLSVTEDTLFDLKGNQTSIVGGGFALNATSVVIEASMKITLKVGGSFVVLDPAGVFIKGALVQINSGGSPDSTSNADVTEPNDAGMADPGDPPNWLATHKGHGGGGHKHHTAEAQHGLAVTRNPDGSLQIGAGIKVAGTPGYQDTVVQQLALMNQTKTGKAMLDDYNGTGRSMTIAAKNPPPSPPNAFATPADPTAAANGTGSNSTIDYNPEQWPNPTSPNAQGDAVLFHEMTHAQHNAHGTRDMTPRSDNFDNNEEFNTIGPENQYRDERGIPRRTDHHSL